MLRQRVRVLISNKGEYLEKKINKLLEELEDDNCIIGPIDTNISFFGDKGYQLMAVVHYSYVEEDINELDYNGVNLNFGVGEHIPDCSSL